MDCGRQIYEQMFKKNPILFISDVSTLTQIINEISLKLYEVNFHPPSKAIILFIHAHIVSIYCSHSTSNYPSSIFERCYIQMRSKSEI